MRRQAGGKERAGCLLTSRLYDGRHKTQTRHSSALNGGDQHSSCLGTRSVIPSGGPLGFSARCRNLARLLSPFSAILLLYVQIYEQFSPFHNVSDKEMRFFSLIDMARSHSPDQISISNYLEQGRQESDGRPGVSVWLCERT